MRDGIKNDNVTDKTVNFISNEYMYKGTFSFIEYNLFYATLKLGKGVSFSKKMLFIKYRV